MQNVTARIYEGLFGRAKVPMPIYRGYMWARGPFAPPKRPLYIGMGTKFHEYALMGRGVAMKAQ